MSKYNDLAVFVPFRKRKEYNEKIIKLIEDGDMRGITAEDVFNLYTGNGSLHGLSPDDYRNYFEYAEAKKAIEQGQFFTPHPLCRQIIDSLRPHSDFKIADLTCGIGNFFNYLPNEAMVYGNELDENALDVCRFLYPNAHLTKGDFVFYRPDAKFNLVIGNPPFNIQTPIGISQYGYIKRSLELLEYGGVLAFIVPDSFLHEEFQSKTKIDWINQNFNFVCQCKLPSDTFEAAIETKLLILQKKAVTNTNRVYSPTDYEPFVPDLLYTSFISPIYTQNNVDSAKIHLLKVRDTVGERELQYKISRRLWHIKENQTLHTKYYATALDQLDKLKTQKKPADLSEKDWDTIRLTPEKVLKSLNLIVKRQNDPAPKKITRLVKTQYGLKLKAYHKSLQKNSWSKSVHELLTAGITIEPYKKLYDRKIKGWKLQTTSFVDMARDKGIDDFLENLTLTPVQKPTSTLTLFPEAPEPDIRLTHKQKHDLGLAFQKRYALLAWQQGGGKSIAGLYWIRFIAPRTHNVFILAPALAVDTTWTKRLKTYGYDFKQVRSITDISKIRQGQVILVTYEKLATLQRHIKAYIKRLSYKIALLVDESDELTNATSQRSHAALNCFRKASYKLLTTGTTTRNNINELFTQFELLYNNSSAFICWAPSIYSVDREGNIQSKKNSRQGVPFPPYYGQALFKACFCPNKTTVFGIKKDTQDIYNAPLLKTLIDQTIITRKFEEITGGKKHTIHTHSVVQNAAEQALYEILLKNFLSVCYDYYSSTGVAKKEAALRIVRQIKVLIKASSIPHLMPNYSANTLPAKFDHITGLIKGWRDERVTVGTILKKTAHAYYDELAKQFPYRKILYIDGDLSTTKRRKILEQFEYSSNAILVCTQQSLKSSVDIPYCKKCVIESLQWNIPRISQFYFRFIRFNSVGNTEVHFVTYDTTIEVNLLALLMAKEKLNDFVKTTNSATTEAIYQEFGIDLNILDSLIKKSYDENGRLYLTWGNQRISQQ